MYDDDLCYLTASEALARFRAGSLSPVELMQAVIARAEALEPQINAFGHTFYDAAMDAAGKAEARYRGDGPAPRSLEGLPVALKDSGAVAGQPTTSGSLTTGDPVAARSSPIHARVLGAGGIVHARSLTPEFSAATFCHSPRWGVTRNPWALASSPGGSSGGAAATLAAGSSILATGSDIGGSIRIPAACCGVVGYMPPHGRNPVDPPFNLDPYCHAGPLARSVGDALLLQNLLCGPHPEDIATLRPKLLLDPAPAPVEGLRIGFSLDLGIYPLDPCIRRNTLAALDVFRDLGATVEEVDPGWSPAVIEAAYTHLRHIFGTSMVPLLESDAGRISPYVRIFAEESRDSTPAELLAAMRVEAEAARRFGMMMERFELFVCPTTALPSVPADLDIERDRVEIDGIAVDPMTGWVMTVVFNLLGRCPVLAVPSGRARNGVPTGIQLVGRSYCDAGVFRAGLGYEAALGGWFADAMSRPAL